MGGMIPIYLDECQLSAASLPRFTINSFDRVTESLHVVSSPQFIGTPLSFLCFPLLQQPQLIKAYIACFTSQF
jgi:hypothetical protein